MLNILFDWVTKPYMKWTFLDQIICYAELFLLLIIGLFLYYCVEDWKEKRKRKCGK